MGNATDLIRGDQFEEQQLFRRGETHGVLIHLTQLPVQPNTVGVGQGVKFDQIIHAGYQVRNATEAVAWYVDKFAGVYVGGRAMRRGGRYDFVNCGQVQMERRGTFTEIRRGWSSRRFP